ncbi:MAG: PAS domain-containing protein, partial [Spirochaetota bacterium]
IISSRLYVGMITDTKGNIQYVNSKFMDTTGYTYEEVINKNPSILKAPNQRTQKFKNLWDTVGKGKVWTGIFTNKKKNGEIFWEKAMITPIKDEYDNIISYIKLSEDITYRRKTEEELKRHTENLEKVIDNIENNKCDRENLKEELKKHKEIIKKISSKIEEQEKDISVIDEENQYQ